MANSKKKRAPSLSADSEGLGGLWHLTPSPSGRPVVMYITNSGLSVWDLAADQYNRLKSFAFQLEERDGERLMLGHEGTEDGGACFCYRLEGDTLEVSLRQQSLAEKELDLSGTWQRIE